MKFRDYFWKNNRFLTVFFVVFAALVGVAYFRDKPGSGNGIFFFVIVGIYAIAVIGTYIAWRKTFRKPQ